MENQEQKKKCFCARCFLPIDPEDKVDIDGQNFHKHCSMCCICRTIPTSLKMFYGHVFCNECFKAHVLNRFKGEAPRMHSNSWWMQWAPGTVPQQAKKEEKEETSETKPGATPSPPPEEPTKKCICSRCLQPVDENNKVTIGGQNFHTQCARCYFCHMVPKDNVKIYYGQVFCEDCFHRHVLNRNKDNPTEFFRSCFEQWQTNPQFNEQMKDFMSTGKENTPFIFMMQGAQPPFCRCGACHQPHHHDWFQAQANEPRKSAVTPATVSTGDDSLGTWELSFENRTEAYDIPESCNESANQENLIVAAVEKIEKLTKYLHENFDSENCAKKWKNFVEYDKSSVGSFDPAFCKWVDLQSPKVTGLDCPKCLWQCGPIFVNSDYFKDCCGDNPFE